MYYVINTAGGGYVMQASIRHGSYHAPETLTYKSARMYSKRDATQLVDKLNAGHEFKKYSIKKVR